MGREGLGCEWEVESGHRERGKHRRSEAARSKKALQTDTLGERLLHAGIVLRSGAGWLVWFGLQRVKSAGRESGGERLAHGGPALECLVVRVAGCRREGSKNCGQHSLERKAHMG